MLTKVPKGLVQALPYLKRMVLVHLLLFISNPCSPCLWILSFSMSNLWIWLHSWPPLKIFRLKISLCRWDYCLSPRKVSRFPNSESARLLPCRTRFRMASTSSYHDDQDIKWSVLPSWSRVPPACQNATLEPYATSPIHHCIMERTRPWWTAVVL